MSSINWDNSQYVSGDSNLYASDDFGKAFVGIKRVNRSNERIAKAIEIPAR